MIIRSIRLKNIKSYGEGVDGSGVTVNFEPGINRIAGKNGHGKTTLIESLGYALFLTRPAYEENFQVDTYLLRTGSRSGEIAITFEHEQACYRLERGVGQSDTRTKVIALADNSIEAEGDQEVAAYICKTLGLSSPDRLSELFAKLIGVKQGRLTWPFDSKPAEAKKFFESLLDVQVFRDCFEKLLPVITLFEKEKQALDVKLSGVNSRIEDRADCQEKLDEAVRNKETQEVLVETLNGQKVAKGVRRQELENFEKAFQAADSLFQTAEKENGVAAQKAANALQRVEEAKLAANVVAGSLKDYDGYVAAEQALKELRQQQKARDKLVGEKAESINRLTEKTGKADACAGKVKLLSRQAAETEVEIQNAKDKSSKILAELNATQEVHSLEEKKVQALNTAFSGLRNWLAGCETAIGAQREPHAKVGEAWILMKDADPAALGKAELNLKNAREAAEKLVVALGEARTKESTLARQLAQIDQGVCPFLQEPCRQFKPEKVQADLKNQQLAVVELAKQVEQSRKELSAAEKSEATQRKLATQLGESKVAMKSRVELVIKTHAAFLPVTVGKWMEILRGSLPKLQQVIRLPELPGVALSQVLDEQGRLHTDVLDGLIQAEEAVLAAAAKMLAVVEPEYQCLESACKAVRDKRIQARGEADSLAAHAETLSEKLRKTLSVVAAEEKLKIAYTDEANRLTEALKELEKKLAVYVELDAAIHRREGEKKRHEGGYNRYMGANELAKDLTAREEARKELADIALKAVTKLASRRMDRDEAAKKNEAEVLKRLREEERDLIRQLSAAQTVLEGIKKDEKGQQIRLKEWQTACRERDGLTGEREQLKAATAITEKARGILKAAAPYVAQSICTRIAGQAQQIFNQVNHEPVLLGWDSDRYSLSVSPGERRFAMLSGGEQTKLALAMTLAMIQEFSTLQFCIFDEPTYGVDAESRQRLADAILKLQTAAGFEQLLLVSHDDSFEGKIEHTVMMQKTAASGSYAEINA